MPRPSTTKLSGTPDEPSAICTRLCASLPIRSIRVAVAGEEGGEVLGPVAHRDAVDRDALAPELVEHLRLGDARHAPAGEDVEQARAGPCEIGRRQSRLAGQRGRQGERRHRLAFELANGPSCRSASPAATPAPRRPAATAPSGAKRTARLMRSALRHSRRRRRRQPQPPEQGHRAAERDQRAARPDQRHERLPPQAAAASAPDDRACRSRCRAGRPRRCGSPPRWSRSAGR